MNPDTKQAKLQEFENSLDPLKQQSTGFVMEILGYGEISTVFSIGMENFPAMAYKRLPVFSNLQDAANYCMLYTEYNQLLSGKGILVPKNEAYAVKGRHDLYVAYLAQQRLDKVSICNKILHVHTPDEIYILIKLVMDELVKVWINNNEHPGLILGLDAQISNWAIKDYEPGQSKITRDTKLLFLDTSTPFIRKMQKEQLNAELLLMSVPGWVRPVIRKLFLQDVLDRYYDLRLVSIDLLANLYKEQLPGLIPGCLEVINQKMKEQPSLFHGGKIEQKEILHYYREDKFIWNFFLGARRIDRFIKTKLLGKPYEFILPGKIKR